MKTSDEGEQHGFQIKGRSRQVAVATAGGSGTCLSTQPIWPTPRKAVFWPTVTAAGAAAGDRGTFVEHFQTRWQKPVHISTKIQDSFAVIPPRRWVVESTFGWFNSQRRRRKDYEKNAPSEVLLLLVALTRTLRSIAF